MVYEIVSFIGSVGVLIYSCLSITLLCDSYFVPSLEFIGNYLHLSPDITGALFTPLGTAGPEVFSSIVGVFVTEGNIGTGAIIGSAVFNLLIIPTACSLTSIYFRGQPLKLNSITIVRDLILYIISIIALILVIQDNRVEIVEASLLVLLFVLIVIFLYYNAQLMDKLKAVLSSSRTCECTELECSHDSADNNRKAGDADDTEKTPLLMANDNQKSYSIQYTQPILSYEVVNLSTEKTISETLEVNIKMTGTDESDSNNGSYFTFLYGLLMAPIRLIMYLTIVRPTDRLFAITFVTSIVWLALLSYVTVTCVEFVSEYVGMSDTVAGMTLLALGNAMPDLVTSIIFVKKRGLADMAICGAIASNRFAILMGLGFPWALKCMTNWAVNKSFFWNYIPINSTSLPYTSLVLLVAIVLLFINLRLNNWVMNRKFAFICVFIHLTFVSIAIYLEYNL
ncbi:sodium/potassium/calcium exchanger 4-like isoform X2 [Oppia nitens]|uniref:sodium/potassium/calcium exchanger 4-like isoform X2 n=1 Tax=Oppia nitens TaxID=1686743 RepID=UPI0023DC5618|nr:sodium/potassium/calcium exchanger 4-like isoform X2 [Oppia nitens]